MKKSVTPQTLVASCVFLDIVGFSKLPTTAQVLAKEQFNTILRLSLSEVGEPNYWVRDLGDGALIICPNSPEHALFLALKVHQEFLSGGATPRLPVLELRIGLNLGVLKSNLDLEGRANYLGDGINATQRVMDFAQPGQILASRSFVDAVAFLHADYATMFLTPQARQDKHGRTHEVYAVEPSAQALARLREDVTFRELHPPQTSAPQPAPLVSATTTLPAPPVNLHEHTVTIIRNWFIPFNALLATVGILWAGFQRFGLSGRHAQLVGLFLVVTGLALWLIFKRKPAFTPIGTAPAASPRTMSAIGLLLVAVGCMVTAMAWLSNSSREQRSGAPEPTKAVAPPEDNGRATSVSPLPMAAASQPATRAKPAATAVVKVVTPPKTRLPVKEAPVAAPGPTSETDRRRCAALLNKSALGESISATEKQEIAQSCR